MSGSVPHVLIVGGDSMIGRAAADSLRTKGWRVTKTTRRQGSGTAIELSMEQVASAGPPNLEQYDAVVVAAAVTAQAACESAAENARLVNVEGPKMLARAAMDAGSHVVFLSTNLVLGGDSPFLGAAAPLAPVGAYARMKAEAERSLQALPGAAERLAILRLTKVLDPGLPLLATWRDHAAGGEAVTAFSDLVIAPVSLSFAANALTSILQAKAAGIFHCSGSEELSYADFARAYLASLGLDEALICAIEGRGVNPIAAAAPCHASLAHHAGCTPGIGPQSLAAMLDDLMP